MASPRLRALRVVVVASSVAAVTSGGEASANPPAPQQFPDPFVVAPKAAERPNVMRKYDGGCFVSYPSGGTAKIDCPTELSTEPVGQEIDRNAATGKCTQIPTTSWSGGSTGDVPCPAAMLVIASPGVMPTNVAGSPTGSASASDNAGIGNGFDPPMGGLSPQAPAAITAKSKETTGKRLEDDAPPKASGCGSGCAIGAAPMCELGDQQRCAPFSALALVALAAAFRVRRSKRLRSPSSRR